LIKAAIDDFIGTLASRNFKTRLIMTDGEGAVGKSKTALNLAGIELNTSGAGGHVPTIERRIQVIKQRVRAYISHRLPYTLNTIGISMCVLFCVSRMNYEIPGTRPNGPSLHEVLTGARARGAIDFRCSFGDFALPTVPATDNSPSARVEECIVMLLTGNRTGSVKFLPIKTNKIVTRNEFKTPLYIIAAIIALAVRDGRTLTVRTTAPFGPPTIEGPLLIALPSFYDEELPDDWADIPPLIAFPPPRLVDDLANDDLPPAVAEFGSDLEAAAAPPANQFTIGVDHADDGTVGVPPDQTADQDGSQKAGALGVHHEEYGKHDDIADVDVAGPDAVGTNVVPDIPSYRGSTDDTSASEGETDYGVL
jgi:hypothetical protein